MMLLGDVTPGYPLGVSGVNLFNDFVLSSPFPSAESLH